MSERDFFEQAEKVADLTKKGFQIGVRAGRGDVSASFEWRVYQAELKSDSPLGRLVVRNIFRRQEEVGKIL